MKLFLMEPIKLFLFKIKIKSKRKLMASQKMQKSGKVVVIGDGACGKTCLLEVFRRNTFPEAYIPTVVDNFAKDVTIEQNNSRRGGTTITLALWDTAGQEDYDTIRPLSYRETDLVLICYTIENKKKIPNISKKWLMEIKNYCPKAGYFLIGLKADLRSLNDPTLDKSAFISTEEGQEIADSIKAEKFIECSARTGENVNEVFKEAAKYINENKDGVNENAGCGFCFCC
ncbi:GTP-binding protein Rho1 [Nosema bombycis CQ1]|uniref:GTP-binding protein Rho1 n=1 Tax=Nosema bombycis (strain CQ1 / CVCC 102059) TaxID=578461 RepID=R0KX78_NOSB1|nr:GTP-binding protein Rho1 [Nosema bombycis CQ1]|eukprot:EOB15496.1 GTP-binding protein Rho1 [Nosema bombycis CQ1]